MVARNYGRKKEKRPTSVHYSEACHHLWGVRSGKGCLGGLKNGGANTRFDAYQVEFRTAAEKKNTRGAKECRELVKKRRLRKSTRQALKE